MEKRYLLSVKKVLDGTLPEQMLKQALEKVDPQRQNQYYASNSPKRRAEILGGGLLIQLGLGKQQVDSFKLTYTTVEEIVEKVQEPQRITYRYESYGKPFLERRKERFSLSHSGEFVFCAFSEDEIGADIQMTADVDEKRLVERFFSEEEKKKYESFHRPAEKRSFFYRSWCRKEAYGKLTGRGVGDSIGKNIWEEDTQLIWEEYEVCEEYYIAVCRRKIVL